MSFTISIVSMIKYKFSACNCCQVVHVKVFSFPVFMLRNLHNYCSVKFANHFVFLHYAAVELPVDPQLAFSIPSANYLISLEHSRPATITHVFC